MDNKYYTPTIDEFYIGFEYELLVKDEWHKLVFNELNWFNNETKLSHEYLIKDNRIRVKYLDKEDIESLGFMPHPNLEKVFCYKRKNEIEIMFYKTSYQLIISDRFKNKVLFIGSVKNINELKILLKQLGIDDNF